MKLTVLVLTIFAVNGKPVTDSAAIKHDGADNLSKHSMRIFDALDAELRNDIEKNRDRVRIVMTDSSRALGDRYKEMAEIMQQAADLWKQATPKQEQVSKNQTRYITSDKEEEESEKFIAGVDSVLVAEFMKDMEEIMTIMADNNKTLGDRYKEIAAMVQQIADLWKQVAQKKNEAPVTAA